jgi:acetate kinase
MTAEAISDLLYQSSGLLGVSGLSDDMKTLIESTRPEAAEAVELFVYRIGREPGRRVQVNAGFGLICTLFLNGQS